MQQTNQIFTDQQLKEGFLQSEESVLQFIYSTLRPEVLKAVSAEGGSTADGSAFFLAAVADLPQLLQVAPEALSFQQVLTELALAHYHAWLSDKAPKTAVTDWSVPADAPTEDKSAADDAIIAEDPAGSQSWLPAAEKLAATRQHIFVWKSLGKLKKGCSDALIAGTAGNNACRNELAAIVRSSGDSPVNAFDLPDWAEAALLRKGDFRIWEQFRIYEQNLSRGLTMDGRDRSSGNAVAKYLFLFFLVATVGYLAYAWLNKPRPAGEIFKENFAPPESLLADINRRFENDTSGIDRPDACEVLLKAADELYAAKRYSEALEPLVMMFDDDNLPGCRSDALFAMGIVHLKLEEPTETLQCLAKIDNIETYGEDLYWYQALAFVQLAKQSPSIRPRAKQAVDRFLENTKIEERRQQAQKMLEQL